MKKGTRLILALPIALALIGLVIVVSQSNSLKGSSAQNLLASNAETQADLNLYKEQGEEQLSKIANSLGSISNSKSNLPEGYLRSTDVTDQKSASSTPSNQVCLDLFNSLRALKIANISNSAKVESALKLISVNDLKLRKVCSISEYESFFKNEFTPWINSIANS